MNPPDRFHRHEVNSLCFGAVHAEEIRLAPVMLPSEIAIRLVWVMVATAAGWEDYRASTKASGLALDPQEASVRRLDEKVVALILPERQQHRVVYLHQARKHMRSGSVTKDL